MGESLCHFSLCICSGKAFVWKMASSLFQNTSEGLLDVGYTTEVLVIFFPRWPFHLGQALKESALSSDCCPVLLCLLRCPWCLAQRGWGGVGLRGSKISTCPVGIENNFAIM